MAISKRGKTTIAIATRTGKNNWWPAKDFPCTSFYSLTREKLQVTSESFFCFRWAPSDAIVTALLKWLKPFLSLIRAQLEIMWLWFNNHQLNVCKDNIEMFEALGNFWESSPSGGHKTGWGLGLTTDKWLPHTKFPFCEIEEKKIFEDNKLLSIWGHMKTNKNCTIYKWFNL